MERAETNPFSVIGTTGSLPSFCAPLQASWIRMDLLKKLFHVDPRSQHIEPLASAHSPLFFGHTASFSIRSTQDSTREKGMKKGRIYFVDNFDF